ncbi:cation:proton antiporter [Cesiribacter sp. SM1]|uniref:cation:proton antiporter domain-containing protein n=1 Tax=Cesiribacter sp. SM1 TaxID=2861196 RepID=UPI001CD7B722|nr:cation:proton antiporter [Cesiribacter sp. SM1]
MKKSLIFYIGVVGLFVVLMYGVVQRGQLLETDKVQENSQQPLTELSPLQLFSDSFAESLHHPLAILLLQIISILFVARLFGYLFSKIGQPTVIGEIIAGIVLGPSLLGWLLPGVTAFVFPAESLGNLQFLSQVGLILFMFVIGMDLDIKVLRNKAHDAVIISHASIIIPYFLGMALAYFLYSNFAPADTSFLSFALFMGIAMSITAFPVLARVIQERNLSGTQLGTITITCAAADDITAWCLLAAVIAITKAGTALSAIYTIILAVGYVLLMIKVVQPFLKRMGRIYSTKETITKSIVAVVFLVLLGSSYLSEVIGIHALFGAFLAGVIMPPNLNFRKVLTEKIEDVALVLLLPLFFVFTGLRTQIGLLNDWSLWAVCLLVSVVAVAGKFGGSALAARFVGQSWKESLSIGALMNTRGLMELVVLNIGYDLGILSPEIFAMMVLMALITTFMTGPALDLIDRLFNDKDKQALQSALEKTAPMPYQVLLSFGPPLKGRTLLWLADQMSFRRQGKVRITALHLTPNTEIDFRTAKEYERESFKPTRQKAAQLGIKVETVYRVSDHVGEEIVSIANDGAYDLLLVGASQSLFSDDQLGGKVKTYLEDVKCDVGVLIDRNFGLAEQILLVLGNTEDFFLLNIAKNFIENNGASLTILDPKQLLKENTYYSGLVSEINSTNPRSILISEEAALSEGLNNRFNLLLVTYKSWTEGSLLNSSILESAPSTLVLKQGKERYSRFTQLPATSGEQEILERL